jgi:hypothetical protein
VSVARFEERLWGELVEQHGALLADAPARAPIAGRDSRWVSPRRRWAPAVAVATTAAVALAAIVIGLGSGSRTSSAFAVVRNADGTVSVTIAELAGVDGADARLAALGVPARVVRSEGSCPTRPGEFKPARITGEQSQAAARPSGPGSVVIVPGAVPAGDTVVIGARELPPHSGATVVGLEFEVYEGATPPCLPIG